jgi:hypothetical protein
MSDFYVYVYIDPRNFEEFYYGKGKGSRKDAHLGDASESPKARRIADIRRAGMEPIIRVVARGLSEHDALLVEKTLLWKLGGGLTNISTGHYSDKFRPANTMHVQLGGFDFASGLYYYNVGEGGHRSWDDYVRYGFISGGQGPRWRDAMLGFKEGDVFAAFLKRKGFVGIGRVLKRARPVREVLIGGRPLLSLKLDCKAMAEHVESDDLCEYVSIVEWLRAVDRSEAKWQRKAGLFTTQHVRASLDNQPQTIDFLNQSFKIDLHQLTL